MIPETLPSRRLTRRQDLDAKLREVIALRARQHELYNAQRHPTLIELPEPIRYGWERYFFVRPELAHTSEGPALAKVLALAQNVECSHRRDFAQRDWRRGGKKYPVAHRLVEIQESDFWDRVELPLRRYFEQITHRQKHRDRVSISIAFAVKNPGARFVSRTRPYYLTHRALPCSEAESELQFIDGKLYGEGWPMRHLIRLHGEFKDAWDLRDYPGPLVDPDDAAGLSARIAEAIGA